MIIFFLAGAIVISVLWMALYRIVWDKGLSVRITFGASAVYAGETVDLVEEVTNEKKLPVPVLEVAFHMPKGIRFQNTENNQVSDFVYRRDIFSMLGSQKITRVLELSCDRRGLYEIGNPTCNTYSMLYRNKYIRQMEWKQESAHFLYVYAKRTDVSKIMVLCENILGEIESDKKMYEDPFSFASIREYTVTDPMKTINWKASAKTGALMVNTYTSVKSGQAMIYLDVDDSMIVKQEQLLEESISAAATLAQRMRNSGLAVGFSVNLRKQPTDGKEEAVFFAPSRARNQQAQIERILAGSWTQEDVTSYRASLQYIDEQMVPVFISKNATEENKEAILQFLGKARRAIWVVPLEKGETCPVAGTRQLLVMPKEVS